jgi:hypothetical protein
MSVQIADGGGSGRLAEVSVTGRLLGDVIAEGPLEELSLDKGDAIFFHSIVTTGGTDVEVMSVENEETTKNLHITRFLLGAADLCTFTILEVTGGTPAGTVLVGVNPNFGSTVVNSITAFGNAAVTGSVVGDTLFSVNVLADATVEVFVEGSIIIPQNSAIAISATTSTVVHVTMIGFWR